MKYDTFKAKVKREFAAWMEEEEARRPRVQPGSRITSIDQLRAGDFIAKRWGGKYKIVRTSPQSVVVQEVDNNGRPKRGGREKRMQLRTMMRNRMTRIEELKRQDVSFDTAVGYVDSNHGFPPRSVTNKEQYAEWLKTKLTEKPGSPFFRLGDDEPRHQDQLKRHLERILEHRNVGDDWSWTPPPPVQIGQRVQHPSQLKVGDFVRYYSTSYRIIDDSGDSIRAIPVDANGRPAGAGRDFDQNFFRNYPVKRVEAVQRPDISLEDAKKYADEKIGFPPRDINTRAKYREWLENHFKTDSKSPYNGLGSDEVEHTNALEKQIKKILEDRDVGAGWEWEAPPELEMGARLVDGHQLRPGHFLKGRYRKYKVISINDDGTFKAVELDSNGRPVGRAADHTKRNIRQGDYSRIEEVKRPEVIWRLAKLFADERYGDPGRSVTNKEKYRAWLERSFTTDTASPYYQLGDDEPEHKAKLDEYINKLLEERDIGDDWVWTPPPPITFPPNHNWEADHKAVLDVARDGTRKGRDREMGGGVNAPVRRKMKAGDREEEFIFKSRHREPGQRGSSRSRQLSNKTGVPSGQMHNREAAAYELDRLLGDGTVVPITTTTGEGDLGLGAYQQIVPGIFTAAFNGQALRSISNKDLLRHPDVGRLLVMDALMGHQDRHHGNMAFSWIDPNGPKTAQNLRVHGIDNGYGLAETKRGQNPSSWDIRDNWGQTGGSERTKLLKQFFERIPDQLLEQLKDVTTKDVTKALASSGLTNKSLIESVALRLAVMKADPELLGRMIAAGGSRDGQQQFQYQSHHKQKKLLQEAGLPESTLDDIKRDVAAGLRDS
jgi:hypothetical protein